MPCKTLSGVTLSPERWQEAWDVGVILSDKLSNHTVLSNFFRTVPGVDKAPFKDHWINAGFECNDLNIRNIMFVYFYLLDSGKILPYWPFDPANKDRNYDIVKKIVAFLETDPDLKLYPEEDPTDARAFVEFILTNYVGFNKETYDKEQWQEDIIAERKEIFRDSVSEAKSTMLKTAGLGALGLTLIKVGPPVAIAFLTYYLTRGK